eukprot:XP_011675455.1 PREDICTED: fibropellin-1-like isoform X2 [Strongylocentrotus purpuratus]
MTSYQTRMAGNMMRIIMCILSSSSWYYNLSVEAYSTGAPVDTNPDICNTMTPNHQAEATTVHSPYHISVESLQYTPGQPLGITVIKSTSDPDSVGFKGIFMQMRRTGTDQITGTWSVTDETNFKTVSCQGVSDSAVTHRNNIQKVYFNTFTWNAPFGENADVNVVATYVDQRTTFWVKEMGQTLSSKASGLCNPNPCQNGGSCLQSGNSFTCTCPPPYTGTTCQTITALPCNSNPCLNGGSCVNTNQQSSFTCLCNAGFAGLRCEVVPALPCNSNPCLNGGSCVNTNQQSSFTCLCNAGYAGLRCEAVLALPCNSNPCANGGSCFNTNQQSFFCACPTGYSGSRCDQAPDPCSPNPCLQQGTCISLGNDFFCVCPPLSTGKTCNEVVLPCDSDPCLNGGFCQDVNMQQELVCACQMGFSGTFCQIDDPCYPNQCLQQGTCTSNGDDFICSCPPSHDGKTCSNLVDPCVPDPCINGGRCIDLNLRTEFFCTCVPGFKGVRCEEEQDLPPTTESTTVGNMTTVSSSNLRGSGRQLLGSEFLIFVTVVLSIIFLKFK